MNRHTYDAAEISGVIVERYLESDSHEEDAMDWLLVADIDDIPNDVKGQALAAYLHRYFDDILNSALQHVHRNDFTADVIESLTDAYDESPTFNLNVEAWAEGEGLL